MTDASHNPLSPAPLLPALCPDDLGGFWIRMAAWTIDFVFTLAAGMALGVAYGIFAAIARLPESLNWLASVLSFCFSVTYFTAFQAMFEGTLGKRAMGLRLVTEDLATPSVGTGFLRYVALFFGNLVLGLCCLSVAWNPRKQGWHDRIARTFVVHKGYLERARAASRRVPAAAQPQPDAMRAA